MFVFGYAEVKTIDDSSEYHACHLGVASSLRVSVGNTVAPALTAQAVGREQVFVRVAARDWAAKWSGFESTVG